MFNELNGDKRKIYTTRTRWGGVELISKHLKKFFSDNENQLVEKPAEVSKESLFQRKLNEADVNMIRDTALLLENIDIKLSYNLMKLAQKERPKGPFINKKAVEYKKKC